MLHKEPLYGAIAAGFNLKVPKRQLDTASRWRRSSFSRGFATRWELSLQSFENSFFTLFLGALLILHHQPPDFAFLKKYSHICIHKYPQEENIKVVPVQRRDPRSLLVSSNCNFNAALWGQDLSWRPATERTRTYHRMQILCSMAGTQRLLLGWLAIFDYFSLN